MKILIQLNLLLLLISSATAQEASPQKALPQQAQKVLRDYDWKNLARQQALPGEVISTNGFSVLKIEITNDTPQDILLLRILDPAIIKKAHFLVCEAKREYVSGPGDGRLLNQINNTTSLSVECPLPPAVLGGDGRVVYAKPVGTYGGLIAGLWTFSQFELVRDALEGLPTQLEVHLYTRGRGTIYLRPIRLLGIAGSWWSPQQADLIGGIGGTLIGCLGGLIGLLVSKGRARNFALAAVKGCIALGVVLMIAGLVAAALKQPYAVWYALLLPGIILTLVFSLNLHSIQRRYDELEIRRMTSMDAAGS